MGLESMMIYSCAVCGNAMAGMEWEEHKGHLKDFKCPDCNHMLNEDELYGEDADDEKDNEMSDVSK